MGYSTQNTHRPPITPPSKDVATTPKEDTIEASSRLASPDFTEPTTSIGGSESRTPSPLDDDGDYSSEDEDLNPAVADDRLDHKKLLVAVGQEQFIPSARQKPFINEITEISFTEFDPLLDMPEHLIGNFSHPDYLPTAIDAFRARQIRVKEAAHLTLRSIGKFHIQHPKECEEHCLYCVSEFVPKNDVKHVIQYHLDMLDHRVGQPVTGPKVFRETIVLLHAAENDEKAFHKFGVRLTRSARPHVSIVDTQKVGRRRYDGQPISLRDLAADHGAGSPCEHNSSNDSTNTLFVGLCEGVGRIREQDCLKSKPSAVEIKNTETAGAVQKPTTHSTFPELPQPPAAATSAPSAKPATASASFWAQLKTGKSASPATTSSKTVLKATKPITNATITAPSPAEAAPVATTTHAAPASAAIQTQPPPPPAPAQLPLHSAPKSNPSVTPAAALALHRSRASGVHQFPEAPYVGLINWCGRCHKNGHMMSACRQRIGECGVCKKRGHLPETCMRGWEETAVEMEANTGALVEWERKIAKEGDVVGTEEAKGKEE